ncbi:DUF4279 domain-containing protein [Viridibacillus sp. FSL R5-0477]|uniref:DUF4279 domain-containing protein n=1 Tax=Viridibacillus arenosi FSL R5-213 TaxID=1227360 RepID=W4F1C9_9BACL|nr:MULTISPECIES: DUF4279 domain-containing protein [Viridibacillus]ETT86570.1 hypothetical protein C176_07647 [Viridibacillus arenosi FSL R5-213]OMC86104.1 hypothetical protein BK128_13160 [Viridibacillus sp. FSL H7-0596]OMC91992.1 hypothetical protein BK137_06690 [Viridibacillus arenosi]
MAYFSAFGDNFPLEEVTNGLDVEPTETYKKGDVIKTFATKILRRKETSWTLSTGYQESLDINEQLDVILKSLKEKTKELLQLKKKYDLQFQFMIVIEIENNDKPAMYLQKNIIDFSSSIDAEIQFDLYVYS